MEGRLKKLLHRRKGNDDYEDDEQYSPSPPQHRAYGATALETDSTLHSSPYDAVKPAGPPVTGTYPIRGSTGSSPVAPSGNVSRSPVQHRAGIDMSSNQSKYQYGAPPPTRRPITTPDSSNPASDIYGTGPLPGMAMSTGERGGARARQNDGDISQDFSNLNLGIAEAPRSTLQPQVPSYAPNTYERDLPSNNVASRHVRELSRGELQSSYLPASYRESSNQAGGVEAVGRAVPGGPRALHHGPSRGIEDMQTYGSISSPYSAEALYDSAAQQAQEEADFTKRNPIPRKQVGAPPTNPSAGNYSTTPSQHQTSSSHMRQSSLQKPLPMAPTVDRDEYQDPPADERRQSGQSTDLRPVPLSVIKQSKKLTAEEVVRKASGKSFDTEVIEKIAPAVVHETVNEDIHHVRQEIITREVHNHDVYHRILPIIDVEVLPPRHFLPVEGGGLVEISADEVPGRGNNWVIAETASKIPSDEPAPHRSNRFSAREFIGDEGDFKTYVTPEGYERTEQTWVHHPELETGGRDSGQTWPMVFGDADEKVSRATPAGKSPRRKSDRKHRQTPIMDQGMVGGANGSGARYQPTDQGAAGGLGASGGRFQAMDQGAVGGIGGSGGRFQPTNQGVVGGAGGSGGRYQPAAA